MRAQGPGTRGERERALASGGEGGAPRVWATPRVSSEPGARSNWNPLHGLEDDDSVEPSVEHLRRELVSPHQFSFPGPDGMVDGREAIQPSPHESVAICAIRDFPGKERESVQDVRRFLAEVRQALYV